MLHGQTEYSLGGGRIGHIFNGLICIKIIHITKSWMIYGRTEIILVILILSMHFAHILSVNTNILGFLLIDRLY